MTSKYYSIASSCDGASLCQAVCNPGYNAATSVGPCVANACAAIPANATACSSNALPSANNQAYSLLSSSSACTTTTACQAYCKPGHTLNSAGTACQ